MAEKNYALVDKNNKVVNVVVIDDEAPKELYEEIAKFHSCIKWYDMDVHGDMNIGDIFDGEVLLRKKP